MASHVTNYQQQTKQSTTSSWNEEFVFPVEDEKLSMLHAQVFDKNGKEMVGDLYYPLGSIKRNFRTTLSLCLVKKGKQIPVKLVLVLTPVDFGRVATKRTLIKHETRTVSEPTLCNNPGIPIVSPFGGMQLPDFSADPFSQPSESYLEKLKQFSLELPSYYQSAYICLWISAFAPLNVTDSTDVAKNLFQITSQHKALAATIHIDQDSHFKAVDTALAFSKYSLTHLKHYRKMDSDSPDQFQTPDYYRTRKDAYTQQYNMLLEASKKLPTGKLTKTLFVRVRDIQNLKQTIPKMKPSNLFVTIKLVEGKNTLIKYKTKVLADFDGDHPVWDQDFVFDLVSVQATAKLCFDLRQITSSSSDGKTQSVGKVVISLADVIKQTYQTHFMPILGSSPLKNSKLNFGLHFTERHIEDSDQPLPNAVQEFLSELKIDRCFQVLSGVCQLESEENSNNRWVLREFVTRFGLQKIYQKLLVMEYDISLFDPSDSDKVNKMHALLQGLQNLDRSSWSKQELRLFSALKDRLATQIEHILLNFVYYVEKLAAVDMKAIIKCFQFIKGPQYEQILLEYFKTSCKKSYEFIITRAKSSVTNLGVSGNTPSGKPNSSSALLCKTIITLSELQQIIQSKLDDSTRLFYNNYSINTLQIFIEGYSNLLAIELNEIASAPPDLNSPSQGKSALSQTELEPTEVLVLIEKCELFQRTCRSKLKDFGFPANPILYQGKSLEDLFGGWIGHWLEYTNNNICVWMDRTVDSDKWEPVNESIMYSVGMFSLQESITQNMNFIHKIKINHENHMFKYIQVACNGMLHYVDAVKAALKSEIKNSGNIPWQSLDGLNAEIIAKVSSSTFPFARDDNILKISASFTAKSCIQLNNIFHVPKILENLSAKLQPLIKPETFQLVSESVFSTVSTQLEEANEHVLKFLTDMVRHDIAQALRWYTESDTKIGISSADPLFSYLNHNLSICNSNCESDLFKTILRSLFLMLVRMLKDLLNPPKENNNNNNLLDLFKRKQSSARELSKRLGELTEEICTWAEGDGGGLPESEITEMVHLLRVRLQLWSAPTTVVYETYQNGEFGDVSKAEIVRILKSRQNDDSVAKEFLARIAQENEPKRDAKTPNFLSFLGISTS